MVRETFYPLLPEGICPSASTSPSPIHSQHYCIVHVYYECLIEKNPIFHYPFSLFLWPRSPSLSSTFLEDFRRTACTSLLQHIVERSDGEGRERVEAEEEKVEENLSQSEGIRVIYCTHTINCNTLCHSQCQANTSSPGPRKRRATRLVSPRMIDKALHVCQEFLNSLDHIDIDVTMETPPSLTEQQWVKFMHDYYLVVQ